MGEPIRICHVVGNMVGGGVEQVVMNYFEHIDHNRFAFDLIVTDSSTSIPYEKIQSMGGQVYQVPSYKKLIEFNNALYSLFQIHSEWKIVHSHLNTLSVFPLREAKRAGIPIRIAHSHSSYGPGEPLRNTAKLILRKFSNIYPTHRFACSKAAGDWLFCKRFPYEVVYNAIELDKFYFSDSERKQIRYELGLDEDVFVIGHVGRFVETKNQQFILNIFKQLIQQRPKCVLCFVGSGETEKVLLDSVLECNLSGKVKFLGQREDINRLYQAFDVFVLPSLYEGLGMAGIEAQAAGLPCIFSNGVTTEVDITNTSTFISLENSKKWLDILSVMRAKTTAERANIDKEAFNNYDIKTQSLRLSKRYETLYRETR